MPKRADLELRVEVPDCYDARDRSGDREVVLAVDRDRVQGRALWKPQLPVARPVPDQQRATATPHDHPVAAVIEACEVELFVVLELRDLPTRRGIPHARRPVVAGGHDAPTIGGEHRRADNTGVTDELSLARAPTPDLDPPGAVGRDQARAGRIEVRPDRAAGEVDGRAHGTAR